MTDLNEIQEKMILIGISTSDGDDTKRSMEELSELVRTAGAETVGCMIQNRESMHPATYLGKGKLEEAAELVREREATGVVCDDELSPAQLRNMEEVLGTKVIDRTLLILDIFAARAATREGKIQVELAQLRYRATHLAGLRSSLSRLGGGIGTRGPGEKKLETDRRLIHERIGRLKGELEEVKRNRELARKQRSQSFLPTAAIVGYTNAGKSTLLNALTDAGAVQEDMLFATLDPLTRKCSLPDGQELLLTDTVGFIRKLPHHLIEAFRSTLEEAKYADLILHVVDASNPDMDMQMYVVYDTLRRLNIVDKTVITLFNKTDRIEGSSILKDFKADRTFQISAKTGAGFEEMKEGLQQLLRSRNVYLERLYSYSEAGKVQLIRRFGQLKSEEYTPEGIAVTGYVPAELYSQVL